LGFGDEIIATGLARGAMKRGKLIAFGNGDRIIWSDQSRIVFKDNPNIAVPGNEKLDNLEWISHYRGNRMYGKAEKGKWKFKDWKCPQGEIFFSETEKRFGLECQSDGWPFVVIEPRVKLSGACAGANKQWPVDRYTEVAQSLIARRIRVVQLVPPNSKKILPLIEGVETSDFRLALAVLARAVLYIGPEGGLHHGAAAVGTNAVVIFGGFNSPRSTGYEMHENISVGEPCGSIGRCLHCKEAMESISVERVLSAAVNRIRYPVETGVFA
jgi:ADP-heptose:LPS heptosyltransferase